MWEYVFLEVLNVFFRLQSGLLKGSLLTGGDGSFFFFWGDCKLMLTTFGGDFTFGQLLIGTKNSEIKIIQYNTITHKSQLLLSEMSLRQFQCAQIYIYWELSGGNIYFLYYYNTIEGRFVTGREMSQKQQKQLGSIINNSYSRANKNSFYNKQKQTFEKNIQNYDESSQRQQHVHKHVKEITEIFKNLAQNACLKPKDSIR